MNRIDVILMQQKLDYEALASNRQHWLDLKPESCLPEFLQTLRRPDR